MTRIPAFGGHDRYPDSDLAPTDDELADQEIARQIERSIALSKVTKLSPAFGRPARRRAQLIARLKRRRKYANPVKGGTGRHKRKGGRGHFKA